MPRYRTIKRRYFVVDYYEQANTVNEALKTKLQGVQGATVWFHNVIYLPRAHEKYQGATSIF